MMADTGETTFVFKANTKPAEEQLDQFGDKVIGIGKKIGAAVLAYASFSALKAGIEKSIEAAVEAEQAVLAFNSALSLSGKYSESASQSFQDFALSLEKTTGVQDEIILKNSSLLVSLGKLSGDGLERATKAALDLSRGMQVDVGTAFDIVTKATQGNVMALARYGLEVNKSDSDSVKFAKTLEFIEGRFGNMATGNINTFEGALTKMSNGFNDIFESIGKVITESPKAIAFMSVLGDAFYAISESIAGSSSSINGLIDGLFKVGDVITNWVLKPLEIFGNFLAVGFSTIVTSFLKILEPIAPLLDRVFKTDYTASIKQLGEVWAQTTVNMAETAGSFDVSSSEKIDGALDRAKTKVDELASKMTTTLPQASAQATAGMASSWDDFWAGFKAGVTDMSKSIADLGKQVSSTFVNGFSNAFASMGKAIVKGQNVMAAFGGAILSTLGSIAIQMGQFYIAAGLATMFLNPASGLGMILAGGALATLGGVLQALGSGGETPAAGGGGGTTGADGTSTSGGNLFGVQTPDSERAAPQTGVQVVVQGNVFDSKETGLQIANILNESFDTNGTIVRAFG